VPHAVDPHPSIKGMTHSFPASFPPAALLGFGAAAVVVVVIKSQRRKSGAAAGKPPLQNERGEEEIQLVEQSGDNTPKHRPSPCVYGEAVCCPRGAVSEEQQQQQQPKQEMGQNLSFADAPGSSKLSYLKEVQQPPKTAESLFIGPSPCVSEKADCCPTGACAEQEQQQLKPELEQHHAFDAAPGSIALSEPEEVQQPPPTAELSCIGSHNIGPPSHVYEEAACYSAGAGSEEKEQQLKQELERHDSFDVAAAVSCALTEPDEVQQPPQTAELFFVRSDSHGSGHGTCAPSPRQGQLFHIGTDLYEAADDSGPKAGTDISLCSTPAEHLRCPLEQEAVARIQHWYRKHARLWRAASTFRGKCGTRKETCLQASNAVNETSEHQESMTSKARPCIVSDGLVNVRHDTEQDCLVAVLHDAEQALQEAFKIVLAGDDLQEPAKESVATDSQVKALNQAVEAITFAKARHMVQTVQPDCPMNNTKTDKPKQTACLIPERRDSATKLQMEEPEKEAEPAQTINYTLEQLTNPRIWRGLRINPTERESMLPDSTFRELFQMEKEAFRWLPKWKRDIQKKKLGLF